MTRRQIELLQVPAQAIFVDGGRPGWAHLAITRAGPYDQSAYERANRLVGNLPGAAAVEYVLGPLNLRTAVACNLAVCGVGASVRVTAEHRTRHYGTEESVAVPADAEITIGVARHGVRGYLAVRGGFAAERVLGSRSRDTLGALGPAPLQPGDVVGIEDATGGYPSASWLPVEHGAHGPSDPRSPTSLPLLPAPRDSALRLPRADLAALTWTVSPDSDRVGMRLSGASLPVTAATGSEPLVRGAVQVPPDGRPVIMGPDHPTTGGYPVIGVVARDAWDVLAQLRPGDAVRLVPLTGRTRPTA
ncbi:MAG: biotin-dependent carboxyltransferase family protein [Candidatus Nanopelagicales bacterium]